MFDSLIAAGNSFQIVGAEKLKERLLKLVVIYACVCFVLMFEIISIHSVFLYKCQVKVYFICFCFYVH